MERIVGIGSYLGALCCDSTPVSRLHPQDKVTLGTGGIDRPPIRFSYARQVKGRKSVVPSAESAAEEGQMSLLSGLGG